MIRIIDDFLDDSDIIKYTKFIEKQNKRQSIIKDEKITTEFLNKYKQKIGGNSGILSFITLTKNKRPLGKHKDSITLYKEKYKILIYLNEVINGGTIFYIDSSTQLVENKKNRLVIFDINLPHESQKFKGEQEKIAIGFRLIDLV